MHPPGLLSIRAATEADVELVASLVRECFRKQAEALSISPHEYPNYVAFETAAIVRKRMASGANVALAFRDEQLVGTVSWRLIGERGGEVTRLGVIPLYRGRGFGHELMAYAERQLSSAGAVEAQLSIVAQFRRLEAYYTGQGYATREVRRVPSLPFEILYMAKALVRADR